MKDLPPDELRNLQVVAAGLIVGPVVFFAIGVFLRLTMGRPLGDVPALTYAAVAFAVASPMLAGLLRGKLTDAESAVAAPSAAQTRGALITYLGILEGAAFLCAMAAVIPLGTMLASFPRRE